MEKIFALFDSDVFYATRFIEYFKRNNEYGFEVSAFTKQETLEDFLKQHNIEILLVDGQINTKNLDQHNIRYIYRLTELPCMIKDNNLPEIYKYQSAKTLMNEIMVNYIEKESKSSLTSEASIKTNIISIFAPIPSMEKIFFAWSVSSLLSEHERVLFVLLDPLPIQVFVPSEPSSRSLTEFIYYLKERVNINERMAELTSRKDSLSYMAGIYHGADIISLNSEDIQTWVGELKNHPGYDKVVFYLGFYTDAMIELMKLSDTVLVPTLGSSYENDSLKEWERQMNQIGINIRQDKFQRIELPREDSHPPIPFTMHELSLSAAWENAQKYLNF